MIQKILIAISIPFFFLLQACVFTSLELGNVIPNLMVLIVCVYGFFYGEKTGAICGFFAGLLMDIFFSEMLGLNALIIMLIGWLMLGGQYFNKFRCFFRPDVLYFDITYERQDCFYRLFDKCYLPRDLLYAFGFSCDLSGSSRNRYAFQELPHKKRKRETAGCLTDFVKG